jgi:hypothetical protein
MRAFMGSCVLLALACGGGSKTPAQPGADSAMATIDEAIAMFVDMGEVVMSAADDCGLMATRVSGWIDEHGARRKAVNSELLRIQTPANEDAYRQRLAQHVDLIEGMAAGVAGCDAHPDFMRAWKRLDE